MARSKPKGPCYACDAEATTWDHVPPKGFYPRRKDVFRGPRTGPDFRRGLIEVPACPIHNNARSKDDAYSQGLIVCVAASDRGSLQADDRSPFIDQWIEKLGKGRRLTAWLDSGETVTTSDGPMIATTVESEAISRVLEATARGLYFHHHSRQRRWPGSCNIKIPRFADRSLMAHPDANALGDLGVNFMELERRGHPTGKKHGPHPRVFYYQLSETAASDILMRMVFYGSFSAFAIRHPSDSPEETASDSA